MLDVQFEFLGMSVKRWAESRSKIWVMEFHSASKEPLSSTNGKWWRKIVLRRSRGDLEGTWRPNMFWTGLRANLRSPLEGCPSKVDLQNASVFIRWIPQTCYISMHRWHSSWMVCPCSSLYLCMLERYERYILYICSQNFPPALSFLD